MMTRVLTAVIGIPVLVLIIWLGGWVLAASVAIVSLIALHEYIKAVGKSEVPAPSYIFTALLSLIVLIFMKYDYYSVTFSLIIVIIASFTYEIFSPQSSFYRALETIFFILYVPLMLGFILLFENTVNGEYTIWLCFLGPFATDTFAYFGGRLIGGPKLTQISPNKTIAGSVSGVIACALVFVVYGLALSYYFHVSLSIYAYIALGVFTSIVGQIGDLTASLIKRTFGVKDYGKLLPGHGGILDRFDSVIFTIPVIYFFTSYFFV